MWCTEISSFNGKNSCDMAKNKTKCDVQKFLVFCLQYY